MRFAHRDGSAVHLAYCSNVHPAQDVEGIVDQLRRFAGPVRERLGAATLGVGLWLPAPAAAALRRDPRAVERLRRELADRSLEVVTFNGFPYRAFHAPVVKRDVYRPDWTDPARLAYTLDLAWLLARLLPDDAREGSISTLPLAWRAGWTADAEARARAMLARAAEGLERQAHESGRPVRLALEPEPGCVIETAEQAARALADTPARWIGVCLDACHLAVQFEEPADAVRALSRAGVPVVKAQLSSALRFSRPRSPREREVLEGFVEPRFLHQTRELATVGERRVDAVDDLPQALAGELPGEGEWRVHFHVPVHADGGITTQPQLDECLRVLMGGETALTRHLEVETYTWSVLPADRRPADDSGLIDGLAAEIAWARGRLLALGLQDRAA